MDEASRLCGLDLSQPEIFSKILEQRTHFEPETFQGDILQLPSVTTAQLADIKTGFTLPPVQLGNETDLVGHSGYDRQKTIEYSIHFKLPSEAHSRLIQLVHLALSEAFRNNDKDLSKFIGEAYEKTPSDDYAMALKIFLDNARVPWRNDDSILIKERTSRKDPRPVSVCSAEGVDHSGFLNITKGSIVKLHVRIVTWGINGVYGASLKLSDKGIMLYRLEGQPVKRCRFVPGNFYLCVRPDDGLEIRDACGMPMRVSFPRTMANGNKSLLLDEEMVNDIHSMEEKLSCPVSCVHRNDENMPFLTLDKPLSLGSDHVLLTPQIYMNNSWRTLRWVPT